MTTTASRRLPGVRPEELAGTCQFQTVDRLALPASAVEWLNRLARRGIHIVRRRWRFLRFTLAAVGRSRAAATGQAAERSLAAGDWVRVRPAEEIEATLDGWRRLRGCAFMDEMKPYCGTAQRVRKPVRTFIDEHDYRMKRTKGLVLLEGVYCQGTADLGPCDRSCFYFWRQEWLSKIEEASRVQLDGNGNDGAA